MFEYLCLMCEHVWKTGEKEKVCPECYSSDILTEDPEMVDDYDGHFEGDMTYRGNN